MTITPEAVALAVDPTRSKYPYWRSVERCKQCHDEVVRHEYDLGHDWYCYECKQWTDEKDPPNVSIEKGYDMLYSANCHQHIQPFVREHNRRLVVITNNCDSKTEIEGDGWKVEADTLEEAYGLAAINTRKRLEGE